VWAAAVILTGVAACKVDDNEFQGRVFRCDTSAADPLCGTDSRGNPMQCFAARQIGATDFCTQSCGDLPMSLPDEGMVCVQGNAKLKACNPRDDLDRASHPTGACDRAEFGCLRTDVLPPAEPAHDQGVCLTMRTCSVDKDCRDPVRSTCAATFLKQVYAHATDQDLHADNLYCLQEGCDRTGTSCSPGESCLRKVVPLSANPPDICVPDCDSQGRCPPNHFCLRQISGPGNPAVCIPGLLGFVCNTDLDCLAGTCADDLGTGADHGDNQHLCTTHCDNDAECAKFDGSQGTFLCNLATRHCATPLSYRGAVCNDDSDCFHEVGATCVRVAQTDHQGSCLHSCAADGACLPRGGVNQTCLRLWNGAGTKVPVCLPGNFGYPCFADQSCTGDLSCRGSDLTTQPDPTPGFCTVLCADDQDCAKDRWAAGSWCGPSGTPYCFPPQDQGPCDRNVMCASGVCDLTKHACIKVGTP
jgi:hypothetical protein